MLLPEMDFRTIFAHQTRFACQAKEFDGQQLVLHGVLDTVRLVYCIYEVLPL